MNFTEEQLDRAVYDELKSSFAGVSGWIYQDFFKDEAEGFKHFKCQFDDMKKADPVRFDDQDSFYAAVEDFAEEIASELRRNNFLSTMQQCLR